MSDKIFTQEDLDKAVEVANQKANKSFDERLSREVAGRTSDMSKDFNSQIAKLSSTNNSLERDVEKFTLEKRESTLKDFLKENKVKEKFNQTILKELKFNDDDTNNKKILKDYLKERQEFVDSDAEVKNDFKISNTNNTHHILKNVGDDVFV